MAVLRQPSPRTLLLGAILAGALGCLAAGPVAAAEPDPGPAATAGAPTPGPTGTPAATAVPDPTAAPDPTPTPEPAPADPPQPSPSTSPDPTPTADPSPTPGPSDPPEWSGELNLFRSGRWVRQYWNYTCTAASVQTMLNLILHRSERSSDFQQRIIRYERRHDTLATSAGSDPEGWANALTHFGGGAYDWKVFDSRAEAVRYAATRLAETDRPVGLLVWRGKHAWTMTGFRSKTDPRTDPDAVIKGVYVAPPLKGVDPTPNTYITVEDLDTFARYRETDGLQVWVGRWVVVAPTGD